MEASVGRTPHPEGEAAAIPGVGDCRDGGGCVPASPAGWLTLLADVEGLDDIPRPWDLWALNLESWRRGWGDGRQMRDAEVGADVSDQDEVSVSAPTNPPSPPPPQHQSTAMLSRKSSSPRPSLHPPYLLPGQANLVLAVHGRRPSRWRAGAGDGWGRSGGQLGPTRGLVRLAEWRKCPVACRYGTPQLLGQREKGSALFCTGELGVRVPVQRERAVGCPTRGLRGKPHAACPSRDTIALVPLSRGRGGRSSTSGNGRAVAERAVGLVSGGGHPFSSHRVYSCILASSPS